MLAGPGMALKRPPGELTAGGENNIAAASRAAIQLQTKGCGYSYRTHLGTIALKTTDASPKHTRGGMVKHP